MKKYTEEQMINFSEYMMSKKRKKQLKKDYFGNLNPKKYIKKEIKDCKTFSSQDFKTRFIYVDKIDINKFFGEDEVEVEVEVVDDGKITINDKILELLIKINKKMENDEK